MESEYFTAPNDLVLLQNGHELFCTQVTATSAQLQREMSRLKRVKQMIDT